MRKTFIALIASLALAGCATTGGGGSTPQDVTAQIRAYTQQACGFLPVAEDVLKVIAAFYPQGAIGAAVVTTVGRAICAGTTPPASLRAGVVSEKRVVTPSGVIVVRSSN